MVTRPNPSDFKCQSDIPTTAFLLKMYPDASCEFCGVKHNDALMEGADKILEGYERQEERRILQEVRRL